MSTINDAYALPSTSNTTPTDVYNYAINSNPYYPKPQTLSKRSTNVDPATIDPNHSKKLINFTELWIKAENNKEKIYPFAVLVLAAVPVLLLLCTSAVGFYTKTLVIIIYLLMIALTVYLFKK